MTAQTDVLARALAVSGLVVAAGSLGWQFINHRLTGARVRCELRLALHDDRNPAGTYDLLASGSRTGLAAFLDADRDEFPHEAALITVRNRGRTAVSVHYPVLDWGDSAGGVETAARGFEMPTGFCRLEPGEAKQWLTPLWPSLKQYRDAHPEAAVTVRAAVQLGTGRWCRSSRRNSWTIPAGISSLSQAAQAQSSLITSNPKPSIARSEEAPGPESQGP
jgi:hypothetical protein